MKILYCIPNLEHGGAERQTAYLAAEMLRRGHQVHVAARSGGPNLKRILAAGVTWHPLEDAEPKSALSFQRVLRPFLIFVRLLKLIRELKPDVVQTVLAPMDMLGGAAALILRTPWVLKECSSALIYKTYRRYWCRFVVGRLADGVISNSAHVLDYWRAAHPEHRLFVIPNSVPLNEIAEAIAEDTFAPASNPKKLVLYAGRIDIGKNVQALLESLARMAPKVPFNALICGDGAHRLRVEQLAHDLGIAQDVFFTGYVDNLWSLMKRADVFVSFSRVEGCPNVILEAMACECPLLVSDIPGHREVLKEDDALFVRLEEPEAAALAIRAALTEDRAARTRANSARARVFARPSLDVMAQMYESAYAQVIAARAISTAETRSTLQPQEWNCRPTE